MKRNCQRKKIINQINSTNDWDMLNKIEKILDENPIFLRDFVRDMLNENYGNRTDAINRTYCNEEIVDAFQLKVREIWMNIPKLKPESNCIDHWSQLYVVDKVNSFSKRTYTEDLDLWISEHDCLFNPREIAYVIFNIWCGKVTFTKNNGILNN